MRNGFKWWTFRDTAIDSLWSLDKSYCFHMVSGGIMRRWPQALCCSVSVSERRNLEVICVDF